MGGCHSLRKPKRDDLRTKYFIAASRGDLVTLKNCLEKWGHDINDVDLNRRFAGFSALHKAVSGNHVECVKYLLDMGIQTDLQVHDTGHTALTLAAEKGSDTIIELLLQAKDCPVNHQTGFGQATALHLAVGDGHYKAVNALLEASNIDLNIKSVDGTPVQIAMEKVLPSIAIQLLEKGATLPKNACGKSYLEEYMMNIDGRMKDLLKYLIEHHFDPNYVNPDGLGYLHLAVQKRSEPSVQKHRKDILSEILKKGVLDLNSKATKTGDTALHCVTKKFAVDIMSILIDAGADVNARNKVMMTPLHTAVHVSSVNAVTYLLSLRDSEDKQSVDIEARDSNLNSPLQLAVNKGSSTMIVDLLIRAGADVRVTDEDQRTLLHSAVTSGSMKMLEKVIQHKAPNLADKDGCTPLALACQLMREDFMLALFKLSHELVNLADNKGNTPLMLMLEKPDKTWSLQHKDIFMKFLSNGADVTIKNADGITPIERAHSSNNVFALKGLAGKNCKLDTENSDGGGNTKLHLAASELNVEMVKFLLSVGANANALNTLHQTPLLKALTAISLGATDNQKSCIKEIVNELLSQGGDRSINQEDSSGYTALYFAVSRNFPNIVELLINNGASPNTKPRKAKPLLHVAARLLNSAVLEVLIKHKERGLDLEIQAEQGETAVSEAFEVDNRKNFNLLLKAGATVPEPILQKDIVGLILDRRLTQVEMILDTKEEGGATEKYGAPGMSPLEAAILCSDGPVYSRYLSRSRVSVEFIKRLIEHGASPSGVSMKKTPYTFLALSKNRGDIFCELLRRGADPLATFGNKTLLHVTLEDSDKPREEETIFLLDHGGKPLVNICLEGTSKISPLMMAVLSRSVTVVASLLQCGADPDYRLNGRITHKKSKRFFSSFTPLELALCLKQEKIVKLLLLAGADANAVKWTIYTNGKDHKILSAFGWSQLQNVAASLKERTKRQLLSRKEKKDSTSGEDEDDDDDSSSDGSPRDIVGVLQASNPNVDNVTCELNGITFYASLSSRLNDDNADKDSSEISFISLATGDKLDSFGPSFDTFCSSFSGVDRGSEGGRGSFSWGGDTGDGGGESSYSSHDYDSHDSGWGGGGCSDSGGGGGGGGGGYDSD